MGRRCKLSPELSEEICLLIRKGCPVEVACRAIGIARSTYYSWLSQGEAEEATRQEAADQGPEWITTSQAGQRLGLSVAKLREAARAGEFKAEKRRGRWFLDKAGLLLWAEPEEGSPYFQLLEAVRQAEAEAEAHLVEFWQEQTPKDWRAARDLLARRFPERWSERRQIEAQIKAQTEATVEVTGEMKHEIEVSESELKQTLAEFKNFMLRKAVEHEQLAMDVLTLLGDGLPRSVEDIAKAIGQDQEKTSRRLQDMTRSGQVRQEEGAYKLTWTPTSTDDDQSEEPPTPEPFPELPDWEPPAPGPPPRRAPIMAGKSHFAKLRDGELEGQSPRPAFLPPNER